MSEKITIQLSDWLFNAGIVGLMNIMDHNKVYYEYGENTLSFELEAISNFEQIYNDYLVYKYKNATVYAILLDRVDEMLCENERSTPNLEKINKGITYLKQKLVNSAYINLEFGFLTKELKKVKKEVPKSLIDALESFKTIIKEHESEILLKEIVGYYDQKSKVSKSPLAIVDKYINTSLFNLIDSYESAVNYRIEDKSNHKFNCFQCDSPVKKIEKGLNFLNNMYFDTARKTSHVWNFNSDIEPCPICKLVYMCIPAGITTFHGRGIFINANTDLSTLKKTNNSIYYKIFDESSQTQNRGKRLSYYQLINSYLTELIQHQVLELNDVQVVEMNENKYHFVMLSKRALETINRNMKSIERLNSKFYIQEDEYFNLYDEVIRKLIDNESLTNLVDKLTHLKIKSSQSGNFYLEDMINLIKIDHQKGGQKMLYVKRQDIDQVVQDGVQLKYAFKAKNSEHKVSSLAYKLQGALRANNPHRFMDAILASYSYVNIPIPKLLINCLKDDQAFKTLGYAYTSALVGNKEIKEQKELNNKEEAL